MFAAAVVVIPPGPDKHRANKHNTGNMRAVDKRIVHTLILTILDCVSPLAFNIFWCLFLCMYHITVCVCVCVCVCLPILSQYFLQSHSHRITQHCAIGYSSTKAFSFTITSSSLSPSTCVCFYRSSTCPSLCASSSLCLRDISCIS